MAFDVVEHAEFGTKYNPNESGFDCKIIKSAVLEVHPPGSVTSI